MAALLIVLLAAGAGLWAVFGHAGSSSPTAPPGPSTLGPAVLSTDAPGVPTDPSTTDTSAASATVPATGDTAVPTTAAASPDTVQLSPGVTSPAAATVVSLLQGYFTAINTLDYSGYATAMLTPTSASSFTSGYRSVHDSQVMISSIDPTGPDSATVILSFVSTQDINQAPPTLRVPQICWQQQLPVTQLSAGGKIGPPPAGTTTMRQC